MRLGSCVSACAFVIAGVAGCSSSDPPPSDVPRPVDAPRADAACQDLCDPLTAAPCVSPRRCTWLVDPALPRGGQVQCLPSGGVPANVGCTRDALGGDPCVRGTTCYEGTCRQICDLAGGMPSCSTPMTCKPSTLLASCAGGTPTAGLCVP